MSRIAVLDNRFCLHVQGADTYAALQGALSCDIAPARDAGRAVYGFLLTPQGKILCDLHVIPGAGGVTLDCGGGDKTAVLGALRLGALGRDARISEPPEALTVCALFGSPDTEAPETPESERPPEYQRPFSAPAAVSREGEALFYGDARDARLGMRAVLPRAREQDFFKRSGLRPAKRDAYDVLRIMCLISEGGRDFPPGGGYPIDYGAQAYGAVSMRKGCYTGQEVTARMYHKGTRKKALVRLSLAPPARFPQEHGFAALASGNNNNAAMLLTTAPHVALALVKNIADTPYGSALTLPDGAQAVMAPAA